MAAVEKKQIGVASYGLKKKNKWNVEDNAEKGDAINVYRVLPPFGAMASDGKWAFFDKVHWGYKDSNGWSKNFRCIEKKDFKTKMILQACPECDLIAKKTLQKTKFIEQQVANGQTEDQAKEAAKPLTEWLKSHNLDKKWYLNVKNAQQEVGRLKVAHKHFAALQTAIGDLLKKGIDPIDVNGGVWFNFKRTGKGPQTQHYIYIETETITMADGRKVQGDKPAPLTEDDIKKMQKDAYELDSMHIDLTFEQIKRLVDGGGDQSVVDAVYSMPTIMPAGAVATATGSDNDEPDPDQTVAKLQSKVTPVQAATVPPPVATPVTVVAAVVVDDEEAQMMARLASIRQKKAEALAGAAMTSGAGIHGVGNANIASVANVKAMDDKEFLSKFGAGGLK